VKYAIRPDGHFAQIKHYTLYSMLDKLRHNKFDHADLVVYFCLYYFNWKYRSEQKGVVIYKSVLSELTGIKDAPLRVKRLYDNFLFIGNSHLFEYQEFHHKLMFTEWAYFFDPAKSEHAFSLMESYNREIDEIVRQRKDSKANANPPVSLQTKRRKK
jgi:hypothetical protein